MYSPGDESVTKAYSGDLSNLNNAKQHNITKIKSLSVAANPSPIRFSVVKLCPRVPTYTPVSLKDADQFDFQTSTSGKLVYFNSVDNVHIQISFLLWFLLQFLLQRLKYTAADVFSGSECDALNSIAPAITNFDMDKMVCAPVDTAVNSCKVLIYSLNLPHEIHKTSLNIAKDILQWNSRWMLYVQSFNPYSFYKNKTIATKQAQDKTESAIEIWKLIQNIEEQYFFKIITRFETYLQHLCYDSSGVGCYPVLVIDNLNAALLADTGDCIVDSANTYKANSILPFIKMASIKSSIAANALVDLI